MSKQIESKINRLEQLLPEGLLVDASWLEGQGYYRSLRAKYVSSGWLEQPIRGVYRRPRGKITWEQVVVSLQTLLGYPVSLGGRTALELQGYAHYVPHVTKSIHLYTGKKLPTWLNKLPLEQVFVIHNRERLIPSNEQSSDMLSLDQPVSEGKILEGALRVTHWGQWKWPLIVSTPERAYLEMLDELPQQESFDTADMIMEGLANLSPRRMQALLEQIKSIKVKRLFLFFADRYQHQWCSRINHQTIDLGSGKRVLVKGGKLDPVYQITVPEELIKDGSPNGI